MKNLCLSIAVILFSFPQTSLLADDKDFPSSGTINPGESWDNVSIYDTPPDFTTVNMFGGQVGTLDIGTFSTLNIEWGMITNLNANDNSFVNIWDGMINNLYSSDSSRITVNGGDFGDVAITGNSRLKFYDGFIQNLDVATDHTTYISAGQIETLCACGGALFPQVFEISAGSINTLDSQYSYAGQVFNLSGGWIQNASAACYGNNIFNISAGYVGGLEGRDNMTINVTGGDAGPSLGMWGQSVLNISHTAYANSDLFAYEHSTLNIEGGEFQNVGVNDQSTLKFSNGHIEDLSVAGGYEGFNPGVYISGGRIDRLNSYSDPLYGNVFNISGGFIENPIQACNGSNIFNITGGEVHSLEGRDNMTINVTGGTAHVSTMWGHSVLNISHTGYYGGYLTSYDNSTLNIEGGDFQNVDVRDQSTLKFSNGQIQDLTVTAGYAGFNPGVFISGGRVDRLHSYSQPDNGTVFNISGGWIETVAEACYGSDVFNISGGEVWGLRGNDQMVINVTGGNIGDVIDIGGRSTLNVSIGNYQLITGSEEGHIRISGGTYNNIALHDDSWLQLRNGSIGSLDASGHSYAILEGGIIDDLLVKEFAAVELYEGAIIGNLLAQDEGIIKIYGYDFIYDEFGGSYGGGRLLGFWLDGREMLLDFADATGDSTYYNHVILIPEPGSVLLFVFCAVYLRKQRFAIRPS